MGIEILAKLDQTKLANLIRQLLLLDNKDNDVTSKHMQKALQHPIASHLIEKAIMVRTAYG